MLQRENDKQTNLVVSIITPSFNSERTIRDTIESVLNQTYKNIEYIIIDGGSTDRTVDIIREYVPRFCGRLRYISEADKGIYNAMNKGIKLSHGFLIGIINSDDFYEKDAVQTIVEHMNSETYQVIYGYCNVLNKYDRIKYVFTSSHKELSKGMIPHQTCFVTRKTYYRYGLFLEWFKIAGDYELMLRFRDKKVQFTQIKSILANFREGGVSTTNDRTFETTFVRWMHGNADLRELITCLLLHINILKK